MPGSHSSTPGPSAEPAAGGGGLVLLVLSSGQFLMTLDASVMNVSIQSVAHDVGTTVSGIQTAITMYTLVMAAFMITGGKIGAIIGRRKAMAIGLVVYGLGSAITAVAPNLGVLLLGWSLLEGLGAALILPAIVALVAGNFPQKRRSSAYGAIAAAGAVAIAVGPIIGGAVTTFASWRWVFVGEVVLVLVILVLLNRIHGPRLRAHASPSTSSVRRSRSSGSRHWCSGCCGPATGGGSRRSRAAPRSSAPPLSPGSSSAACS